MITYSIYLREDRLNEAGEQQVYLLLTQDRKKKYVSLNITTLPHHWDKVKELPTKKHPLSTEIKTFIEKKKSDIANILWSNINQNKPISIDQLINKLNLGGNSNKADLIQYFDQTYNRLFELDKIGYASVYKATKQQLVKFIDKKELSFYDLNFLFLTKFEEWILKRGVSLNSCFVFMRTLKTIINNARKEGIVEENYNPFKDYSFIKFRRVVTKKKALSKFYIDGLKKLKLDESTSLYRTKLYFLFSYYCRGINFKDMAYLKWSDISDNCIKYTRLKTKKAYIIRLEKESLEIIENFKKFHLAKSSFIFPILNETHLTALQQDYRIKKILKINNKDLKEIASLIQINENLTFYAARHTFATVSKKAGIPISIISEAMGHDTERTTNIYLDSFEKEDLDNAFKGIL